MKIHLLVLALVAVAVTPAVAENLTAPVSRQKNKVRERPPAPVTRTEVTGVIPRAIRGGNPLQIFNPFAPRKYGTSLEAVSYDQNDPIRWRGIKFFEFRF